MDFYEVLDKVLDLLRRRGRVTHRALKVQFQLDDEQMEALKEELLYAHEGTLSPLVGRERELAVLEDVLVQVEAGNGQVVGIVGEAGQGKSRVLYEFRQRLAGRQVTYLEGRCLSYGGSLPYHPVIDVLRYHCGVTESDGPESITEKIRRNLRDAGMDADASAPYLLQLLGVKEGTEAIATLTPEAVWRKRREIPSFWKN